MEDLTCAPKRELDMENVNNQDAPFPDFSELDQLYYNIAKSFGKPFTPYDFKEEMRKTAGYIKTDKVRPTLSRYRKRPRGSVRGEQWPTFLRLNQKTKKYVFVGIDGKAERKPHSRAAQSRLHKEGTRPHKPKPKEVISETRAPSIVVSYMAIKQDRKGSTIGACCLSIDADRQPLEYLECSLEDRDALTAAFYGNTFSSRLIQDASSRILNNSRVKPDLIVCSELIIAEKLRRHGVNISIAVAKEATKSEGQSLVPIDTDLTADATTVEEVTKLFGKDILEPFDRIQVINSCQGPK